VTGNLLHQEDFLVPEDGNYTFDYSVDIPRYTPENENFCYDCVYDLEIQLIDECGLEVLDGDPNTPGNQPIIRTLGKPTENFDTDCEEGSNPNHPCSIQRTHFFNLKKKI